MSTNTTTTTRTETKIKPPADFTGDRTKVLQFLQSCELYFGVNPDTYNTDKKKVSFALSFLVEGSAAAWRQEKITKYMVVMTA
jgi:hypothetical protein